jgi:hypothetical protein
MTNSSELSKGGQPVFDPSQFKLQPDGTFRISIRGMAAMAGVDFSGLARSLKSAVDENPLPCSRSLLAQGFSPVDVNSWAETGGIPEDAAPFILEHYGISAVSPSAQARAVLLAFTRVGINAYLKERLGLLHRETQPALAPQQQEIAAALANMQNGLVLLEQLGGCDDRERLQIKRNINMLLQASATTAGALPGAHAGLLSPVEELPRFEDKVVDYEVPLTIIEFASCYLGSKEIRAISKEDCTIGRSVHASYKKRHGAEAGTTTHLSVKAEKGRQRLSLPALGGARNGNAVSPRVYLPRDWDLIIDDLRQRGILAADRAASLRAQLQQFRHGQPD